MRILFLINQFAGGGRERRMVQLVRGLSYYQNFEMHAITFSAKVEYKEILDTKLTTTCISASSRSKRCRMIENVLQTYHPDIVHSWVDTPTEMVLLAHCKYKYKYHYIAGFVADANKYKLLSIRNMAMRYTFCKADAIVSNSKAGLIAKNAPLKKSYVIYNGFDFKRIPLGIDKKSLRHQLNINTTYVCIMFARVNEAKDWNSFISLADKSRNLDISFLAIGNGEKLGYYQKEINSTRSNIRFIGRRSDIESILQITSVVFLFTNSGKHAEGISNSILEAMSIGVPVIASKGGGTEEIISDGKDGYLVNPGDVNQAYSIMSTILSDENLYKTISSNAINKIRTKFSFENMIKSYMDLYNTL